MVPAYRHRNNKNKHYSIAAFPCLSMFRWWFLRVYCRSKRLYGNVASIISWCLCMRCYAEFPKFEMLPHCRSDALCFSSRIVIHLIKPVCGNHLSFISCFGKGWCHASHIQMETPKIMYRQFIVHGTRSPNYSSDAICALLVSNYVLLTPNTSSDESPFSGQLNNTKKNGFCLPGENVECAFSLKDDEPWDARNFPKAQTDLWRNFKLTFGMGVTTTLDSEIRQTSDMYLLCMILMYYMYIVISVKYQTCCPYLSVGWSDLPSTARKARMIRGSWWYGKGPLVRQGRFIFWAIGVASS